MKYPPGSTASVRVFTRGCDSIQPDSIVDKIDPKYYCARPGAVVFVYVIAWLQTRGFTSIGEVDLRKQDSRGCGFLALALVPFAVGLVLWAGFQTARAEEAGSQTEKAGSQEKLPEDLPDRFMIRGGYAYVFNADTTFAVNGSSGVGVLVDFNRTLKGERQDTAWRIDSLYRFNKKHSIGFSYYDVSRSGNAQLTADVVIDEITYAAGAQVTSGLDIGMYRFLYNYSFHHDEKVELAGSIGLYFADIRLGLDGNITCTGSSSCTGLPQRARAATSNLTVPLPSIGFVVNYNFTPRLQAQARFDWFYIDVDQFKGNMNEIYLGLEYRLFKHFAVGGAFDRLDVRVDYAPNSGAGFFVQNDWNMLYAFGALYF